MDSIGSMMKLMNLMFLRGFLIVCPDIDPVNRWILVYNLLGKLFFVFLGLPCLVPQLKYICGIISPIIRLLWRPILIYQPMTSISRCPPSGS